MESTNFEYRGFSAEVFNDNNSESPREWDNLGTMVFFHRRHTLGDKTGYQSSAFESWDELKTRLIKDGAIAIRPVYMYEHGGITISCSSAYPYNDRWDSGQIGFIFMDKAKVLENFSVKKITENVILKVKNHLLNEVVIYDNYLKGEVYGYKIPGIEEDIQWGYFGEDVYTQIKTSIDCHIKNNSKIAEVVNVNNTRILKKSKLYCKVCLSLLSSLLTQVAVNKGNIKLINI
jgi:hypothetical protein